MFYSRTTYLGIDPTAGGRPFTYAAPKFCYLTMDVL